MKKKEIAEINIIKVIASICVIFIHIEFPGMFGKCVSGVAQYAVLLFFMLAGFFTNIDSSFDVYYRRIKKLIILFVISSVSYFVFDLAFGFKKISEYITIKGLIRLLFINDASWIKYHLWFLPALVYTYLCVYWLYSVLKDKIYYSILVLLAIWPVGYGIIHAITGFNIDYRLYRNFLFFGIPAFLIGNFVRIKENAIKEKLNIFILALLCLGAVVMEVLMKYYSLGFYGVGYFLLASLVLLVCVYYKNNPIKENMRVPADISLYVYLIHPMIISIVEKLQIVTVPYLKPVIVAVISVIVACLIQRLTVKKAGSI